MRDSCKYLWKELLGKEDGISHGTFFKIFSKINCCNKHPDLEFEQVGNRTPATHKAANTIFDKIKLSTERSVFSNLISGLNNNKYGITSGITEQEK